MTAGQGGRSQSPQPVTSAHTPMLIVADDLTGACDAAVAFTSACNPVRVQISGQPSKVPCVQAISTESRDVLIAKAEASIRRIVEGLTPNTELFKKIDSVFRGNTIAEIASVLRYAHYELAILAPAYPALGRTMRGGILHIHHASGARILSVSDLLANAGCSLTALPADLPADELAAILRHCFRKPKPAVLYDAASQDELARIVSVARSVSKKILWIGSGGLAHALAAEHPRLQPMVRPRPDHTIFFIGSPHPVTGTQLEHLNSTTRIAKHRSDAMHSPGTDLLVPVVLGETSAEEIRAAVSAYGPSQVGCLFMTGGDTAHFICRALGIQALRLQCEFAPGVPLAIAEGGLFDGASVVLKSGGFGEPDLLCRLLETCRPEVIA